MIYQKIFNIKFLLLTFGIFITIFFFNSSAEDGGDGKVQMCFFELDNQVTSDNLDAKISKNRDEKSPENVEIHRYRIKKENEENKEKGKEAFERMIQEMSKNGKKCDSLVISGHHTGDWFGTDGKGILWLKDMEALSCKKEYQNWFQNIKALWLDGCNTVTDDFIKPWKNDTPGKKNPDSATVKYLEDGAELDKRDMELYQQSYSGSLDENSPLSSRYLRMFPETQIYGFNGPAPTGEQAGAQSFIFKHLADLGKALKKEQTAAADRTDFDRGLKALFSDDPCSGESLKAWEDVDVSRKVDFQAVEHQSYENAKKLGCDLILAKQLLDDPHSSEAQKDLARQIKEKEEQKYKNTEALKLANKILQNPNDDHSEQAIKLAKLSLVQTLRKINEADEYIKEDKHKYSHLLFNNLYDTWSTAKKYENKDKEFFKDVKSQFQTKSFSNSVEERIKSPITASLRKGDYIKFYTEVHDIDIKADDQKARFVKEHINNLLIKTNKVFEGSIRGNPEPRRALAVSVADQLLQYDLLNKNQMEELLKNKTLFPPDTKNPFIKDTWTKLNFTLNPKKVIPTIEEATTHSILKRRAIRIGTGLYLNQIEVDLDFVKENLEKIVKHLEPGKKTVYRKTDTYAFFQALHLSLKGKSEKEKANILLELSSKTTKKQEQLLVSYASKVLQQESVRKRFCEHLKMEEEKGDRGRFKIKKDKDENSKYKPGCH